MTWPDAVPFDPLLGTASPAIEALLEGPGSAGPVVLLAVGPLAQRGGWAATAAIALADGFSARGEQVILADLSLDHPELHEVLDVENDEGLTDVFLFGASLEHTTRLVPGKVFNLIAASAYTPDTAEVLTHRGWSQVFESLAADQCKLLAYLPVQLDGASAFSDRVGHTIVLADPFDLDDVRAALSEDADIIAVLTPPGVEVDAEAEAEPLPLLEEAGEPDAGTGPAAEEPAAEATAASGDQATKDPPAMSRLDDAAFEKIRIPKDSARDALIADLRQRQRAALMAPPPTITPLPEQEAPSAPHVREVKPVPRRPGQSVGASAQPTPLFTMRAAQPTPKRSRGWLIVVLILSLLAAASYGGWYWWTSRPAPAPANPRPQSRAAQAPAPAPAPPTAPGTKLPWSVAIASYQDAALAKEQRDRVQGEAHDVGFYLAPIMVQGKLFYRVMAGPVPDSASALALRDTLVAKRIKTITSGWDVLNTPFAFLIGEFPSRTDAEALQQQADTKQVPTYIVAYKSPEGSTTYRVYAGAFTGPGDADFMRQILKSAGLPDNLVERTGSIS